MFLHLVFIKLLFTFNIFKNINTYLFSEKKLEYNTVQLHVYKEEYIICMMNNIYIQKRHICHENKFKQKLRME